MIRALELRTVLCVSVLAVWGCGDDGSGGDGVTPDASDADSGLDLADGSGDAVDSDVVPDAEQDADADGTDADADADAVDTDGPPSGPVEPGPREPLASAEGLACVLDADCDPAVSCFLGRCVVECNDDTECGADEVCSERGRCAEPSSTKSLQEDSQALDDVLEDVRFASLPARQQRIIREQTELVLTVPLEGDAPEQGIGYRLETADGGVDDVLFRAPIAGGAAEFRIPSSGADPAGTEPQAVDVNVVSSAGSFRIQMIPAPPQGGLYTGTVRITRLGSMGLPAEFMIVTEPEAATLEDATAAWMLLPVVDDALLSPQPGNGVLEWQARPLAFDDFTSRWVARFDNAWSFEDQSLLGGSGLDNVGRTMRFELDVRADGTVVGSITDRWTGLYDARNESGVLEPGIVSFAGTLEASRTGAALARTEFVPAELAGTTPQLQPLPSLTACTDAMLAGAQAVAHDSTFDCEGIATLDQFEEAAPEDRAACAIAVTESALESGTTVELLSAYLDGETTPGTGESFADFMARCAAGVDGFCRPSAEVLCGRQLTAWAYVEPEDEIDLATELILSFQAATREAFLGRQLGAFQNDSQRRLEWLQTSDYPAIVTSAVVDLNARLLQEWVDGVLEVHFQVLAGQYDTSGLAVLARQADSEMAMDQRRTLLFDMSQSWRAAMDAATLATQRWNQLFQDAANRDERRDYVARRMVDLYLLAGITGNLNLAAGSGFANATFGGGFAGLQRELRKLALPFNRLIYARDAEVVVSTSLDPQSDNNTVLRELQTLANGEIDKAAESVTGLLAEAQARALSETQLRNQLANDIEEARNDLVELCGLPVGCAVADYGREAACEVRVQAGQCGFAIDRFSGDIQEFAGQSVTISDAGRAMMAVMDAANSFRIAEAETAAHLIRLARAWDDLNVFEQNLERWNGIRQSSLDQISSVIEDRRDEWEGALADLTANILRQETVRQEQITNARNDVARWREIQLEGSIISMSTEVTVNLLQAAARYQSTAAQDAIALGQIAKEGFPTVVGTANDTTSAGRASVLMAAFATSTAARTLGTVADTAARVLAAASRATQARYDARVSEIQRETEFDDRQYAADLANLQAQAELIAVRQGVRDAEVDRLIAQMREATAAELAYERDLQEFLDRRSAVFSMIQDTGALTLRQFEAEYDIQTRAFEYLQIVQRAELLAARLDELQTQRSNVNALLGSPAVVFAWANRLQQAELRLERAKSALMDWLVAMEYFAVRPFMDQRIQILLARNTYQLEAIAAEMGRLQRVCGGAISQQSSRVSLVSLLGLNGDFLNAADGETYTSGERLRAVLERGAVPVDTRTRYASGQTIGDLLNREEVWSATFSLDLNRFANLASTCNARIVSFDAQLVGENLGDARPTLTVLYDGTSQVRSCQPGITDYVEQFGPGATSFGEITTFRTPTRSVSPVAGLNVFPSDSGSTGNLSLAGLPLASQYTVLIDRNTGENANVPWSRVDDILLRVNYAYQDVFAEGICE
jgi:hypothetical protein